MDVSRVDQLDREKTLAEMQALRNELDPHFVFNSLTSLTYLIRSDPDKALLFDQKLALVFRYFLIHKNHNLVPVAIELKFIEDYFYLLQIRYEHKMQLQFRGPQCANGFVLPCSLQLLLENAIKHNAFTREQPLFVTIELGDKMIYVRNNRQPKDTVPNSTKIGLANLDQRYRLICQQHIVVENSDTEFSVGLPLFRQTGVA